MEWISGWGKPERVKRYQDIVHVDIVSVNHFAASILLPYLLHFAVARAKHVHQTHHDRKLDIEHAVLRNREAAATDPRYCKSAFNSYLIQRMAPNFILSNLYRQAHVLLRLKDMWTARKLAYELACHAIIMPFHHLPLCNGERGGHELSYCSELSASVESGSEHDDIDTSCGHNIQNR